MLRHVPNQLEYSCKWGKGSSKIYFEIYVFIYLRTEKEESKSESSEWTQKGVSAGSLSTAEAEAEPAQSQKVGTQSWSPTWVTEIQLLEPSGVCCLLGGCYMVTLDLLQIVLCVLSPGLLGNICLACLKGAFCD